MRDTRFQALAAQLAGYSTTLRPGDRVLLELTDIPEEMGIALSGRCAPQAQCPSFA